MKIALFVPCYIDAFFPEVAVATLRLLERLGHQVGVPSDGTPWPLGWIITLAEVGGAMCAWELVPTSTNIWWTRTKPPNGKPRPSLPWVTSLCSSV